MSGHRTRRIRRQRRRASRAAFYAWLRFVVTWQWFLDKHGRWPTASEQFSHILRRNWSETQIETLVFRTPLLGMVRA